MYIAFAFVKMLDFDLSQNTHNRKGHYESYRMKLNNQNTNYGLSKIATKLTLLWVHIPNSRSISSIMIQLSSDLYASSNTFFIAAHLAPSVKPIMFSGDSTCK